MGPDFWPTHAWLTFGRVRPAAMNAILYGFCSQAAVGAMIWMLCRLGGTRLMAPVVALFGGVLWNLAVTIGVIGILAGYSTGFEWLEMPRSVFLMLLIAYLLLGGAAALSFRFRREPSLYVSQWYLLAALFWFPWVYSAANLLLLFWPPRGTVQSVVNAWFTNNMLGLWLTPIALAAIFYFIPKLLERPLHNWWLAVFGFWSLAFFSNWSGLTSLVGGPVPAWLLSVSIAANVLMVVPLLASVLNWAMTAQGSWQKAWSQITLRYMAVAAVCYLVATSASIILSFREVSLYTAFTFTQIAPRYLLIFGFVAMSLFGCMHYIVPRLLQMEWPAKSVRLHFWLSTSGIALLVLALVAGGLVQAARMHSPTVPYANVMKAAIPFVGVGTLGCLLFLAGQVILLFKLQIMLRRHAEPLRKATQDFLAGIPLHPEARP